jgi:hypothetical protein
MPTTEIAQSAERYYKQFITDKGTNPEKVLVPLVKEPLGTPVVSPRLPLRKEVHDFANAIVHELHTKDWGFGAGRFQYQSSEVAHSLELLQAYDVNSSFGKAATKTGQPFGSVESPSLDGYGSWLYYVMPGVYAVIYDLNYIQDRCTKLQRNAYEVLIKLFYHELGHLIFHRGHLFGESPYPTKATSAEAFMEREAYVFAGVVVTLAAGSHAEKKKQESRNQVDDAWELW